MQGDTGGAGGVCTGSAQMRAGRVREADMGDAAGAEEAFFAGKGPVDELIDEHEIARCHVFAK
mgnify:CR=1 FL=1